jgi:hypothetical protein
MTVSFCIFTAVINDFDFQGFFSSCCRYSKRRRTSTLSGVHSDTDEDADADAGDTDPENTDSPNPSIIFEIGELENELQVSTQSKFFLRC